MLLALIIGERLMGISGIILAPVVLSFVKVEMKKISVRDPESQAADSEARSRREVHERLGARELVWRTGRRRGCWFSLPPIGLLRFRRLLSAMAAVGRYRRRSSSALGNSSRLRRPKVLEEKLRRFVEQRPSRHLRAPGDFHQAALHQALQNTIHRHSANRFDVGARDRLAVGDDCQRLRARAASGAPALPRETIAAPRARRRDRSPVASPPLFP